MSALFSGCDLHHIATDRTRTAAILEFLQKKNFEALEDEKGFCCILVSIMLFDSPLLLLLLKFCFHVSVKVNWKISRLQASIDGSSEFVCSLSWYLTSTRLDYNSKQTQVEVMTPNANFRHAMSFQRQRKLVLYIWSTVGHQSHVDYLRMSLETLPEWQKHRKKKNC